MCWKVYLDFAPFEGDLRAMPAFLKPPMAAAGVKIVNSNAANPARGLPAVSGVMVYVDPETGLPLGVFAAGNLTALRTGAAGGIAAKYLARSNATTVGLIGCGRQARTQLEALQRTVKITRVLAWGAMPGESQKFCAGFSLPGVTFTPCATVREACAADILVTTTPSREPLIKADWVTPGTHINAIGADAPGKQELEVALLRTARVVVDEWQQASHAGEINMAVSNEGYSRKDIVGQLGEIVAGLKTGRRSPKDITVFDSTGLAIQDVAVAKRIFENAVKFKKGQVLNFHG